MLLGTGIAQEKVDHPLWRAYQEKYNSHHGSIPVLSSTFPKNNALRLYDGQIHTLRDIVKKDPLDLILDEWSDERGTAMLGVIGHVRTQRYAFDVQFLEGRGPKGGVELGLSDVPEIAEHWSLYIRCNVVDINGPTALQEWWQSRAPSPFQERVLFLITQPTSGGDVERFFSQCGTVSKRQHKLDDNIRRLRFMLQFHGDIEGRLL